MMRKVLILLITLFSSPFLLFCTNKTFGIPGGTATYIALGSTDGQVLYTSTSWNGFWKSTDGGETWERTNINEYSYSVVVNIEDNKIFIGVMAGGNTGLIRSYDGLNNVEYIDPPFEEYFDQAICSLAYDSSNDILYAGMRNKGVIKTENDGDSWTQTSLENLGVSSLSIKPDQNAIVIAGCGINRTGGNLDGDGIYKSKDFGETWSKVLNDGARVYQIIFNPSDTNEIFAATDKGIYKSDNAGNSFSSIGATDINQSVTTLYTSDGITILAGTYNGMYKSTDGGDNWIFLNDTESYEINHLIKASSYLYSAVSLDTILKSDDNGDNWETYNKGVYAQPYFSIKVKNDNPQIMNVGTDNGMFYSDDGGSSWIHTIIRRKGRQILEDSDNVNLLYSIVGNNVYKSTDYGQNWIELSDVTAEVIAMDPNDNNVLYAAYGPTLYKSINAGNDWQQIYEISASDVIRAIAISPHDSSLIFLGCGGGSKGIYRSINEGLTFNKIEDTFTVDGEVIVFHPTDSSIIYLGNGDGSLPYSVYKSSDNGDSWIGLVSGGSAVHRMEYKKMLYLDFFFFIRGGSFCWTSDDFTTCECERIDPYVLWDFDLYFGYITSLQRNNNFIQESNQMHSYSAGNDNLYLRELSLVKQKDDLVGTWDSQGVYFRNSETSAWVKLASPADSIAVGNFDEDEVDDLLGIWSSQGGIWVRYSSSGAWSLLSSIARDIDSGDMNGDGRDDLLGTWDNQGVFYKDSVSGTWIQMATAADSICAGDLDDDGKDDLIGVWPGQGGVFVKYSSNNNWSLLSSTARDISSGDMNGDGRDDLLGTWDNQGVFYKDSVSETWIQMATAADSVAAGDMDEDGIDDLIGVWADQGGVWVKYSSTATWSLISSTAIDIDAGLMRGGIWGQGLTEEFVAIQGSTVVFSEGPFIISGDHDIYSKGPGGLNFIFHEQKNLFPHESISVFRKSGPGEPGFHFIKQENIRLQEDFKKQKLRKK